MRLPHTPRLILLCSGCLAMAFVVGSARFEAAPARQTKAAESLRPLSMQARLGANLYIQTSAEYRAVLPPSL